MEDQIYITKALTSSQAHKFKTIFNKEISTEHETRSLNIGYSCATCFELTHDEIKQCRLIEWSV